MVELTPLFQRGLGLIPRPLGRFLLLGPGLALGFNLSNSPMALPRGFRFTSPLASDERRERNAQGRNCLLSSSGRGKIQNFGFWSQGQNETGETCAEPVEVYLYGLPRACLPQAGIVARQRRVNFQEIFYCRLLNYPISWAVGPERETLSFLSDGSINGACCALP